MAPPACVKIVTRVTEENLIDTQLSVPISIIIPAYNEEQGIKFTLTELTTEAALGDSEIIIIDDGSTDQTAAQVRQFPNVRLIQHMVNRGYGAAISTGTRAATCEYVCWFDADGQHRSEDLLKLARALHENNWEYCIGVRGDDSFDDPQRVFGKYLLKHTAQLVVGQPISDFNSGLRGFKKRVLHRYLHLLPDRFGASTTTTLLMIEENHYGGEITIEVRERIGTSSVKIFRDGLATLMIIFRILLLFRPLHFFGLIGGVLLLAGSVYGFWEAIKYRIGFPVFAALIIILGVQAFFFGLLADQISQLRRERFDD